VRYVSFERVFLINFVSNPHLSQSLKHAQNFGTTGVPGSLLGYGEPLGSRDKGRY
jgi:hypothetical protein